MSEDQIVAVAVASVAAIVAVFAWILPRKPKAKTDSFTTRIQSVQDAYDFYKFLRDREANTVRIRTTINPNIVQHADTDPGESYSLTIDRGDTSLKNDSDNDTSGIEFNLFGLSSNNVENVFGWGGGGRGYTLRGTYFIAEWGTGTGGVLWVALQAQKQAA